MKISKILVLLVFSIILSLNVIAVDSLVWKTVDGKPSVQSFNALDSGSKLETEPSEIKSIKMVGLNEGNNILVINSNSEELTENKEFYELTCKDSCVIYTGFEKAKEYNVYEDIPDYLITSIQQYSPNQPIINKETDAKINLLSEKLINEEIIGFENTAEACSIYDSEDCSYYQINKDNRHILRLTNAKISFDKQGKIKIIKGLNREGLETAWIDGFGIPLTANDNLYFSTNKEGETDFSKLRLVINPDVKDKKEWLKNLPAQLKEKDGERSNISLCGHKFTNYFSGSDFLIEKTEEGCSLKEYTLNTELFVEDDIKNWKEFEYQCGKLKFQAMGGKLKELKCLSVPAMDSILSENEQMFRIKLDEYWFSINENSGFESLEIRLSGKKENMGVWFKTKELRVAHNIPDTGSPSRYKGDLIKTIGDEFNYIKFFIPSKNNPSSYYKLTNYLEPQIHIHSKYITEISRKIKNTEYSYSFQEPHTDYILQLGNDLNRGPIVAISPTEYDLSNKEVIDIINYKGDDILTFGVNVENNFQLGNSKVHNYFLSYDPNYKVRMNSVKTDTKSKTIAGDVTIGDYVAQQCYGKKYTELRENEREKVEAISSDFQAENLGEIGFDLSPSSSNKLIEQTFTPNTKITFPGTTTTTFTNVYGNTVKIKTGPKNCPILSAENIKETLSRKKSCGALNKEIIASCVKENECSGKGKKEYIALNNPLCGKDTICCMYDEITPKKIYTKTKQLPKNSKKKGDKPCTSTRGKCGLTTQNECIGGEWLKNKCLSKSSRDYLCCSSGQINSKPDIPESSNDLKSDLYDFTYDEETSFNEELPLTPESSMGDIEETSFKPPCEDSCDSINNKKVCIIIDTKKRENFCDFTCGWAEGSGCLTLRRCDTGDKECLNKFNTDEVDGKTCDMIDPKNRGCKLKQI